jgi:transcriptional regulator GlxA family with amidase domain
MSTLKKPNPSAFPSPISSADREVQHIWFEKVKDRRVLRALESLQNGYAGSGDEIAKGLNISSSRFRHLFKRELGMSHREYQRRLRLMQARQLVINSFLSIKEIAYIVGINDLSHFSRDYKVLYGETPSQTRMSVR